MFFGWDCVSCDDSAIATIRSALQALIHRQVVNLWPLSTREEVHLGSPYEDSDSGSSISSLMVAERNSRSPGDDSAAYAVPNDVTVDILSAI